MEMSDNGSLLAFLCDPFHRFISMDFPMIDMFYGTRYFTQLKTALMANKFWSTKVSDLSYVWDYMPNLGNQLKMMQTTIKAKIENGQTVQVDDLEFFVFPEVWNHMKNDKCEEILPVINQFISKPHTNEPLKKEVNHKQTTMNLIKSNQAKKPNDVNPQSKFDWSKLVESIEREEMANMMKKQSDQHGASNHQTKRRNRQNDVKKSSEFQFRPKMLKWRLKRCLLYELQKSKIVKEIFHYNNLLINFSMTSPKIINYRNIQMTSKLNNKLLNKRIRLRHIKEMEAIGQSWSVGKSYAEILARINQKTNPNEDLDDLNINIQVWIQNFNVDKIFDLIQDIKKKEFNKINEVNKNRINELINNLKKQNENRKWTSLYEKWKKTENEKKMQEEEN